MKFLLEKDKQEERVLSLRRDPDGIVLIAETSRQIKHIAFFTNGKMIAREHRLKEIGIELKVVNTVAHERGD